MTKANDRQQFINGQKIGRYFYDTQLIKLAGFLRHFYQPMKSAVELGSYLTEKIAGENILSVICHQLELSVC